MRVPLTVRAREETSGHVDAAAWGLSPGTVRGARCNKGGLALHDRPGAVNRAPSLQKWFR